MGRAGASPARCMRRYRASRRRRARLPKDKQFIFYCASGMRSKSALRRAKAMGLMPDGHLGGGLMHWSRFEYPIAR